MASHSRLEDPGADRILSWHSCHTDCAATNSTTKRQAKSWLVGKQEVIQFLPVCPSPDQNAPHAIIVRTSGDSEDRDRDVTTRVNELHVVT